MGWWSESIMGGDSPLDVEIRYNDSHVRTAEEAVDVIEKTIADWRCEEHAIKQAVGFCHIRNGLPMNDELRELILEGIAEEDISVWNDPEERDRRLTEFKQIVEAYPAKGGRVDLPEQEGLFDKIFGL